MKKIIKEYGKEIEVCEFCSFNWEINTDPNDPNFSLGEPICCPEAQEEWKRNEENA